VKASSVARGAFRDGKAQVSIIKSKPMGNHRTVNISENTDRDLVVNGDIRSHGGRESIIHNAAVS